VVKIKGGGQVWGFAEVFSVLSPDKMKFFPVLFEAFSDPGRQGHN
jgi:hypothetical protein